MTLAGVMSWWMQMRADDNYYFVFAFFICTLSLSFYIKIREGKLDRLLFTNVNLCDCNMVAFCGRKEAHCRSFQAENADIKICKTSQRRHPKEKSFRDKVERQSKSDIEEEGGRERTMKRLLVVVFIDKYTTDDIFLVLQMQLFLCSSASSVRYELDAMHFNFAMDNGTMDDVSHVPSHEFPFWNQTTHT